MFKVNWESDATCIYAKIWPTMWRIGRTSEFEQKSDKFVNLSVFEAINQ